MPKSETFWNCSLLLDYSLAVTPELPTTKVLLVLLQLHKCSLHRGRNSQSILFLDCPGALLDAGLATSNLLLCVLDQLLSTSASGSASWNTLFIGNCEGDGEGEGEGEVNWAEAGIIQSFTISADIVWYESWVVVMSDSRIKCLDHVQKGTAQKRQQIINYYITDNVRVRVGQWVNVFSFFPSHSRVE